MFLTLNVMSNKMPFVISEESSRTIGRDAQRNNILAARAVADIVKTTLGPKGMDKMLVDRDGNITVTNDGVTILEEIEIEHPAARMMIEIAKTQEREVGDGTTTAVLLAGKLLERAEYLIEKKIHPTVIVKGYKEAAERAIGILDELSIQIENFDILKQIAKTAMTGKGPEDNKEILSGLIIEAVDQIAKGREANIDDVKIEKIYGSSVAKSEIVYGMILNKERVNKEMPLSVLNAKILLIDFPLEIKNPEKETKIEVNSVEQLQSFIESEEKYLRELGEKIFNIGANVVFCQKGIDDVAQYYLAKLGIFACRRVAKSDMEKLAKSTSGKIISNINDINEEQLGKAEKVEEIKEGSEFLIYIRGCDNPKMVSLIIRGSTPHVVDEAQRAVKDGLGDVISAVKLGRIVAGGGAVEIELARRLRIFSKTKTGKEQLAVEEFANALECIPEILAENAGMDPIDIITELKKRHDGGFAREGINLFEDKIEDTLSAGIVEPLKVKTQAIESASEVATLILRVDDVLISQRKKDLISKEID